ncbi:LTA synthase family protein [Enterococcus faecalis]|nr:LTA synthase family protein [Enterococcus faecalis]
MGYDVGNLLGTVGFTVIAIVNYYKMTIRKDSIVPSDFSLQQFKNIYENMLNGEMKHLVLSLFFFIVLLSLFTLYWFKKYSVKKGQLQTRKLINRGILLGISLLFLFGIKESAGDLYKKAGLNVAHSNAIDNVNNNGVIIHYWGNLSNQMMLKPEGYTKEKVKAVVEDIQKKNGTTQRETKGSNLSKPNVIFILSESFWDPTTLKNISFEKDPIPFIHSMIEKSGGKMLSPEFGGNTANVEFNVMTGFSSNFIMGGKIPYTKLATTPSASYSIVENFKENGYQAIAIHPFVSYFFAREQVFKHFGFDQAMFEEELKHKKNGVGAYTSDQQFIEDIQKIDQEQTKQKEPYFLHAISMQNHYPYDSTFKYLNEPLVKGYREITGGAGLNLYTNGLSKTDQAMKELLTYLEGVERETYVVFYGDHLPALEDELYKEHLKVGKGSTYELSKHETPYFIWSNKENPGITGSISPNYFASKVMDKAGLQTTGFQQFLNRLYDEIPAFSPLGYLESNGTQKQLSATQKELLEEYRLLQYDMLEGNKYAKQLFTKEKGK